MFYRASSVVVGAVAALTFSISSASAGEVNGKGDPTPVGNYDVPASICAFSGLNDNPAGEGDDVFDAGKVQSFGDIVQQVAREFGGIPANLSDLQENKPGINCNKNRSSSEH